MNEPSELVVLKALLALSGDSRRALVGEIERAARPLKFLNRASSRSRTVAHPLALTPFALPSKYLPTLEALGRAVFRFQLRMPGLYGSPSYGLDRVCPLHPASASWFARLRRLPVLPRELLIRADVGLREGSLKPVLFETNSTALGGLYLHAVGSKLLEKVVWRRLGLGCGSLGLKPSPDLMDYLWRCIGSPAGVPLAVVEDLPFTDGYSEVPQIAAYLRSRGAPSYHGHPRQLHLSQGKVSLGGKAVERVYRDMTFKDMGRIPKAGGRRYSGLLELSELGRSFPGLAGEFDHKGVLECFTSPRYEPLFSKPEVRLFRSCVPWTRVLWDRRTEDPRGRTLDLFSYARRSKDALVLKPNQEAGGEGVLIGPNASAPEWEKALEGAHREPGRWVVQEYARTSRRWMAYLLNGAIHYDRCYFSLGLFYSSQGLGLHCRVSRFSVVNVARGGALACVFIKK